MPPPGPDDDADDPAVTAPVPDDPIPVDPAAGTTVHNGPGGTAAPVVLELDVVGPQQVGDAGLLADVGAGGAGGGHEGGVEGPAADAEAVVDAGDRRVGGPDRRRAGQLGVAVGQPGRPAGLDPFPGAEAFQLGDTPGPQEVGGDGG